MSIFDDASTAGSSPARNIALGRRGKLALVLPFCLGLAACAGSRGGDIPYHPAQEAFGEPDSPALQGLESSYRISPLDKVKVTVFQVADLTGEYDVDLVGNIAMPLIGNIKAVDLTTDELDKKITQMLSEKYLQSPDVSIGILSSSTRVVTIDGAVRDPGIFPLNGPMTLIQVIARAKGTADDANPRRVAVFRQIKGQRMAAAFDLTDIRRGKVEDPRIYSGDIVVVDGSSVRAAQREVLTALPVLGLFSNFAF